MLNAIFSSFIVAVKIIYKSFQYTEFETNKNKPATRGKPKCIHLLNSR